MNFTIKPKQLLYLLFDAIFVNMALFLAYFFRYGNTIFANIGDDYWIKVVMFTPCFLISFVVFKFYNSVWFHAGFNELFNGVVANMFAGFAVIIIQIIEKQIYLPLIVLATILSTIITLGSRMGYRIFLQMLIKFKKKDKNLERVMIIGAGDAATIAIREMQNNKTSLQNPVCAIDDDETKIGKIISGVLIIGNSDSILKYAKEKEIDTILIAIPSLSLLRKKQIIDICKKSGCLIKTMPRIYEILTESNSVNKVRNIDAEELLGKSLIIIDTDKIAACCKDKTILITGAAGIMGSQISIILARFEPNTLVLVDINETKLLELHNIIKINNPKLNVKPVIQTVKDKKGINSLFHLYRPQAVFHCAFHNKDMFLEESPTEVIRNNIFGTLNLVEAADEFKAEQFMLLSVDKAVNPTHLMSASKRICEMIVQSMDNKSTTCFSSIRFGNTNENAHYYIDKFKKEIENNEPVTLEHKELSRYFMTSEEAANLIIQAGCMAEGGEIFTLDMGNPLRIYDLAVDLIHLSGYEIDKDISILITDNILDSEIRQEVIHDEAGFNETSHDRIFTSRSVFDNYLELKEKLDELKVIIDNGNNELIAYQVVKTVKELIPNFHHLTFEEAIPDGEEFLLHQKTDGNRSKRIFLASPHMGGLETMYVKEAFDTNWIAPLGHNVDEFENEIKRYVDIKAATAMTTGTSAIHMALRMLGVKRGDLVFCSSLTFSGSCNPIIYESAIPVFIDSDMTSWNMSPKALQKAFNECTTTGILPKAVIVVNLYGQSADYDAIQSICDQYEVPIIEDAAESLGATYKNRYAGTLGKYGIFSFNGNKIITTSGGGMLVSNDELAIKKVKFAITQARDQARHYQHSELGFNYRMSNILAGIGRGQLKVLDLRIEQKKNIFEFYSRAFIDIPDIEMMPIAPYGEPNYWLSVITLKETSKIKPLDIMLTLEKEQIESRPLWKPMHLQPYFMKYGFYSHNDEGISISEDLFNRGVCLPSDTKMTEYEMNEVVRLIRGCFI